MKRAEARPSTIFLMELIISILFFAVTSAICVQFLAKSHTINQQSAMLSNAEEHCASIAEIISVSNNPEEVYHFISTVYDKSFSMFDSEKIIVDIYHDNDWIECTAEDYSYIVHIEMQKDNDMLRAEISALNDTNTIYIINVAHHIQKEVNNP